IFKSQSTLDPSLIYDMEGWELKLGAKCEKGSQLRPYIVWFGEPVRKMEEAVEAAMEAEMFTVVGTSLLVYASAGLIQYAPRHIPKYIIDIKVPEVGLVENLIKIEATASEGVRQMMGELLEKKG